MFKLEIETTNDAFTVNGVHELERILLIVMAKVISSRRSSGVCFDINGNCVGSWRLAMGESDEEEELLDIRAACRLLGGSKPIHPVTLYRGIKEGRFPAGIPIAPNARRWRRSKLLAAIEAAEGGSE